MKKKTCQSDSEYSGRDFAELEKPELASACNSGQKLEIRSVVLAKNTVFNLVGYAVPVVVGLISIPFIIRYLGTDRFGIISLAWVVVGYFNYFDLGLGRATTKYVAEALGRGEREKVPGLFWTTATSQIALGLLGFLLLALLTPLLVDRVFQVPVELKSETRLTFYILAC